VLDPPVILFEAVLTIYLEKFDLCSTEFITGTKFIGDF
jgi:hypothetical protein